MTDEETMAAIKDNRTKMFLLPDQELHRLIIGATEPVGLFEFGGNEPLPVDFHIRFIEWSALHGAFQVYICHKSFECVSPSMMTPTNVFLAMRIKQASERVKK